MLRGSCLCGAVRYEVAAPPQDVHHCHCSRCRKAHGAAFSTFARLPASAFRVVAGDAHMHAYRSSPPVERTFCDVCGTRLTYRFDAVPEATWVSLATFDDDCGVRPSAHIFVGSKAPWVDLNDGLPQYEEYPPAEE